tara:strand:- start:2161 stop:2307 length:147 start_codon:yes stop_codon:yes gene_type:complete
MTATQFQTPIRIDAATQAALRLIAGHRTLRSWQSGASVFEKHVSATLP